MFIYLFSLPIWNFVLPTYAYWHFDDFTWGETRKVEGEGKDNHGDKEGEFDSSQITMKKWTEFVRERKIKEAEARSRALVQQHLSSPLSRWSPTNLSFEIDRSTLSTLIGSSLGTSPRLVLPNSSSPVPPPPPPTHHSNYPRDSAADGPSDDEDGQSVLSDETEEIRQWRRSLDFFGGGIERLPTLDTNLPMISNEDVGDTDNWQASIMETIHSKESKEDVNEQQQQQQQELHSESDINEAHKEEEEPQASHVSVKDQQQDDSL